MKFSAPPPCVKDIERVFRVHMEASDMAGIAEKKSLSDLWARADAKLGNGIRVDTLDSYHSDSSRNKRSDICGQTKAVTFTIATMISVMTVAGLIYAAVYLTSHHQANDFEAGEVPEALIEDQQLSQEENSREFARVSQPPPVRRRGWRPVSRDDWGSWTPQGRTPALAHPVGLVIVAHTAGQTCETVAACRNKMKDLQDYSVGQMERPDIPYNFLVGRDGNAYEGVGWDHQSTASRKYSNCSISIAYIGNYIHLEPTPQQLQATKSILALGLELKKLTSDYVVVSHNLTANTLSPGSSVYKQITELPHFTSDDSFLPF